MEILKYWLDQFQKKFFQYLLCVCHRHHKCPIPNHTSAASMFCINKSCKDIACIFVLHSESVFSFQLKLHEVVLENSCPSNEELSFFPPCPLFQFSIDHCQLVPIEISSPSVFQTKCLIKKYKLTLVIASKKGNIQVTNEIVIKVSSNMSNACTNCWLIHNMTLMEVQVKWFSVP